MKESITSHHLMVFMGSFYTNNLEVNNDFITYERNPKANYRLYMDLETEDIIKVLKDNILKFEEENITLYLPILKYSKEEYCKSFKKLQNWFKEQIVNHPLEDVIKEIKSKYERKFKNIYPTFEQIDTINDTPLEEYLEEHQENGFIENYCLSEEEKLVVKLYR